MKALGFHFEKVQENTFKRIALNQSLSLDLSTQSTLLSRITGECINNLSNTGN